MYCESCGSPLPLEAKACPNCGTPTPAYHANSGASPYAPTQAARSSFDAIVTPPPPSTDYGPNPYDVPLQSPRDVNPYTVPPPPPPPRKVSPLILGILAVLVLLIVGASVGFALLRNNQPRTVIAPTATTSTTSNTGNADANASATATAFYSLYDSATSNLPTKDDPLSDNSKGLQWDEGQGCTFTGGAYHVINAQSSSFQECMAHKSNFANFLCQVQLTIVKGSYGSLIFRSDGPVSNFYIFRVGQDGVYTIASYTNRANTEIKHAQSLTFKQGPNQTNLIAVIAQGSHLIFYVNAQYVYDLNDTSFSSGEIGLVAGSIGSPTEVIYNNLKLWAL